MPTALESVHLVAATIGFVSFAALWAGTLWGTVLRSGWAAARLRHQTVHGVHMHLVLLGLWLGIVHGLVQLAAPGGKVRVIDVVVPFTDRADPIGVGLGVIALELMIATALSVLVQRKLGWQRWRALHSLGYLAFTLVAAHLLISGAEVSAAPVRAAVAAAWATVAVAGASTIAPVARMPRALLERMARQQRAEEITVAVDAVRCKSFGFCEQEAPAIFSLRSDRRLAYRSLVPSDQAEVAMRAAMVCPARAIAIGRLPTSVVLAQTGEQEPVVDEPAPVAEALTPVFRPAAVPTTRRPTPEPAPAPGARPVPAAPRRPAPEPVAAAPRRPAPEPIAPAPVRPVPAGPRRPALEPVAPAPAARPVPAAPRRPAPEPVAPAPAPTPVSARVNRGAGRRPAEALPPPSDLADTGRHHLPPLRGLPGGRSGSGR